MKVLYLLNYAGNGGTEAYVKTLLDHLAPQVQKQLISKEEVLALVEAKKDELEVLVTLGAGDIENYAQAITQILKS